MTFLREKETLPIKSSSTKEKKQPYFINFPSQAGRAPQQLAPITACGPFFYPPNHDKQQKTDHKHWRVVRRDLWLIVLIREDLKV